MFYPLLLILVFNFVPQLGAVTACSDDIASSDCRLLMEKGHCFANEDVKDKCEQANLLDIFTNV